MVHKQQVFGIDNHYIQDEIVTPVACAFIWVHTFLASNGSHTLHKHLGYFNHNFKFRGLMFVTVSDSRHSWMMMFLLREWEIKSTKKIQDVVGIRTQDLLNASQTLLPVSHSNPWQRSRRQATWAALPRGLSQILTDSHSLRAGLNWNPGWTMQPLKAQSWHIVLLAVLIIITRLGLYIRWSKRYK